MCAIFEHLTTTLSPTVCILRPQRVGRDVVAAAAAHDLTADLLESVTCLALRSRLRECGGVTASICCDAWSLLQGRVNGVRLTGEGWRSPLNLTARHLEATVGEAVLDITAVLLQRRIVLTNVPVGTARVVFDAPDLGNFLVHPLMAAAAATAAFAFDQHSVRIAPPSVAQPEGAVEFTGTWRSDGQRYSVRLLPVAGGAGGASTGRGRGVQAHAVPLSSGARASSANIIAADLTSLFNGLCIDLQGAEFAFLSIRVLPGLGFAGGLVELSLSLEVKKFPPLDVKF